MANYSIQWVGGVPYKSKLPSAKVTNIDVFLAKAPNFVDGSNHTAAAQVILGGAGMWVTGAFRADSAQITIPSGKTLVTQSGSTTTLGGTVNVSGAGDVYWQTGTTWDLQNGAAGYVRPGARIEVEALGETAGTIQFGFGAVLYLLEGAVMNAAVGSFINVDGDMEINSTATVSLEAGAAFDIYGSGMVVRPGATVSILGTGGSPTLMSWGANTEASFGDGAELNCEAGSDVMFSATTDFSNGSREVRSGYTVRLGGEAYVGERVANASLSSGTLNAWEQDVWRVVDTLTANVEKTLAVPPGLRKVRVTFERTTLANDFYFRLKNHDGATLGDLPAYPGGIGTTRGSITVMFDGANWFVLHRSGYAI